MASASSGVASEEKGDVGNNAMASQVELHLVAHEGLVRLLRSPDSGRHMIAHNVTHELLALPFHEDPTYMHQLDFDEDGFGYISFDDRVGAAPLWLSEVLRQQLWEDDDGARFIFVTKGRSAQDESTPQVDEILPYPQCLGKARLFTAQVVFGVPRRPQVLRSEARVLREDNMRCAVVLEHRRHQADVRLFAR